MALGRVNALCVFVLFFCFFDGRGFVESGVGRRQTAPQKSGEERLNDAAAKFEKKVAEGIDAASKNETAWLEHLKLFEGHDDQRMHAAGGFNCTVLGPSPSTPTSVHKLRPGDIKVIAAMGDSLTAGFGMLAKTPLQLLTEWRGRSWSIGGDESLDTVVTLPNLFRKYNPNLLGFSEGHARINSVSAPGAHLDVAVSGAKAELMQAQATKLIERIRHFEKPIDFEKDWKLVTIFIGANDLCAYNKDKIYYSAEHYYKYLKMALETLKTMPRTFVNLVEVLEATMVRELGPKNPICNQFHKLECPDFMAGNDVNIGEGKQARIRYQRMVETLAAEYADEEEFTVVHQPFFKDTVPPLHTKGFFKGKADLSYFAPDCFHFSAKADAAAAEGLWNNIFEPEHQKRTSWRVGEALVCPTEADPYLKTVKNSNNNKNSRRRVTNMELESWNEARGEFDEYPANTGSAATWSFVAVLVAIACVAILLYYVKTRQERRRDSERSGLLHLDDEDTIFDDRIGRGSARPSTTSSNEVPMQQIQEQTA